jgi:hypothetical protein
MSMVTSRKVWTLEELHSLPDDGNKYELVRGELFVTPPGERRRSRAAIRRSLMKRIVRESPVAPRRGLYRDEIAATVSRRSQRRP